MRCRRFFCLFFLAAASGGFFAGCIRVKTDPIKIDPIYIEITVNHRIQEELDDIFADIDQASETIEYAPLEDDGSPSKD